MSYDLDTLPVGEELAPFLADLSDEDLADIESSLSEAMTQAYGDGSNLDADTLANLESMKSQLDTTRQVKGTREEEARSRNEQAARLMEGVNGGPDEEGDGTDGGEDNGDGDEGSGADTDGEGAEVPEGELVPAGAQTLVASLTRMFDSVNERMTLSSGAGNRDLNKHIRLGDIARHAPDARVPEGRDEAVLVAAADVQGFTQGGTLNGYEDLAQAMHKRAKVMGISRKGDMANRAPVASLQREYRWTVGKQPSQEEINEILKAASNVETLIAAGGWCAPSEISYDFFSQVAESGLLDLPSIGTAERGGIQLPVSLTFGDVIDSEGLWTWTEQDDIDAEDSDSPRKPCVRIPCPEFLDVRLLCDGLCVTAGNLVDFAYPELVQHFLRLLMAARAHLTNAQIIDILVNGGTAPDDIGASTAVDHTGLPGGAAASILSSIELTATDMRNRERMERDAILEFVFPEWTVGPIKADLSNRTGVDFLAVTNNMIANWMNLKDIRAQFVQDWQTDGAGEIGGPTPMTSWPDEVDYLAYSPGTFVRANGLSLDLGVVRDSVLNETNDHTAAWMEDCYLIHKPGPESRVVTVALCDAGETGAANVVCPS